MRILYFDCFSGASGDMILGALLDLGIDIDVFKKELAGLKVDGFDIAIERKVINSIAVTDVDVIIEKECTHHNEHHHHCERNLADIEKLIDDSSLKDNVKRLSKKIFGEIARAEAKVHNKPIDHVHFHEVGAIDSIVDIVGTAICLDLLKVDKIYSSPMHDGTGFIECQHGKLPVPVPAVLEMLRDSKIPYITEDVNTELVTPTGIGIIKCVASEFGSMPQMTIESVGYGAGKRQTGRFNALRCVLGSIEGKEKNDDDVCVLETNIDDMNPEVLGYVMNRLFENGALDVFYTSVYMKKNRPGIILTVLSDREREQELVNIILTETTTLGIRKTIAKRYILEREIKYVNTEFGKIRVKESCLGDYKKYSPEFEDCKEVAEELRIPLWKVYDAVNKAILTFEERNTDALQ
ncbi:nickel pincer cofactor biosynthesis protein LarC [Acetivibrio mesophilus]|uniref:Pyridinium-3,5-bisthiocarboxylic acid mononucleotide nickel insertion protein n=1 Tax=Acetivibrio mesophilus TaxID=2487273 RepID=A0A4Q0I5Q4_9FIRM|nr:nickel pincer cofactor biosynthesis protein LarC [Acetivibrio mesophilus]ODM25784.1 TIGR00299 family protein [Clostridium sp. Bc-iso-3]RXE59630.1 nickel pincer cofactor biosynthesis protein LarC [Acetivibrio mesophilus]HHV30474.1 nickel pincer cofactor biosynthesis protein LarC [Clostridium sp.]